MNKERDLVIISLLAVIIFISGSFKIPGIIPGTEFQISAPIAVAIAACFGFKRYLVSGILASLISLLMGTQTIIHVLVAMTFRIVAGGLIALLGANWGTITLAGPLGSVAARIVIYLFLGKGFYVMLISALPGMIYTALFSYPFTKLLVKIINNTSWREYYGKSL